MIRKDIFSLLLLALVACHAKWVEMPKDYLDQVTQYVRNDLVEKVREAQDTIVQSSESWKIEEENAEQLKVEIDQLSDMISSHLTQLEEAKDNILTHSKHECVDILQDQKSKCLVCVASNCNNFVDLNCDFDTDAESILEKLFKYLMNLFDGKTSSPDEDANTKSAVEKGTKDLHDSTEKLIYQLNQAGKALNDAAGTNLDIERLKSEMTEVADTSKEYIQQIAEKIESSEQKLDILLQKDNEIKAAFEKELENYKQQKPSKDDKSIFGTVWDETKEFFGDAVCVITFGKYCPNKKDSADSDKIVEPMMKIEDLISDTVPSCDQLQANNSKCLHFLPLCKDDCFNVDIKDICPGWYEEWKGYKTAWAVTKMNLDMVYDELKMAEDAMMDAIEKHNEAVTDLLTKYGWLAPYADSDDPFGVIEMTEMKFDPNSFDKDTVNKFTNSTFALKMNDGEELKVELKQLVDPYDAEDLAKVAMDYIEKFEQKRHSEWSKIKEIIKKFSQQ